MNKRNYGIDLLRIVSILGVVFLPILGHGGILAVFGGALAIFISCILIDKIRFLLFRLLKIEKLSQKLEDLTKTVVNLMCARSH